MESENQSKKSRHARDGYARHSHSLPTWIAIYKRNCFLDWSVYSKELEESTPLISEKLFCKDVLVRLIVYFKTTPRLRDAIITLAPSVLYNTTLSSTPVLPYLQ